MDLSIIPSVFVVTSAAVTGIGFHVFPPSTDSKMVQSGLLIFWSLLSLILLGIGSITDSIILIVVSFGIEIGYCVFELIRVMAMNRSKKSPLPVETLVHHICTPIVICFSLLRPAIPIGLLAVLNGAVATSNGVTSLGRILYMSTGSIESKKFGLLTACITGVLCRLSVPMYVIGVIFSDLWQDQQRPEWTRIYATSLLMLMFLNCQLVYVLFRMYSRASTKT
jgi:hypothetical protein